MILAFTDAGEPILLNAEDFRSLSVQFDANVADARIGGLLAECGHFNPPGHAWLDIALLARLGPASDAWREGFRAMMEKAARFDWIDREKGAVRAHIRRT